MANQRSELAFLLVVLALGLAACGWLLQRHRAELAQERQRALCIEIAGPEGYRWVPDAGCFDQNPWTGQFSRVDIP